jgi:hypothetical protein
MSEPVFSVFVVQDPRGLYFVKSGYRESLTWDKDIKKAKVWLRPGPARARVTSCFRDKPQAGMPCVIELECVIKGALVPKRPTLTASGKALKRAESALKSAQKELAEATKGIDAVHGFLANAHPLVRQAARNMDNAKRNVEDCNRVYLQAKTRYDLEQASFNQGKG